MGDYRDNRKFSSLLRRAKSAAEALSRAQGEMTAAFEQRYGATYSDVDADELIDAFDYGHAEKCPSVKQCDAVMAAAGYPPHPKGQDR